MTINAGDKCAKEGTYKCTKCGNEIKLKAGDTCPTCPCKCTTFKLK